MNTYRIGNEYIQSSKQKHQLLALWYEWKKTVVGYDNQKTDMLHSWFIDSLVRNGDAVRYQVPATNLTFDLN